MRKGHLVGVPLFGVAAPAAAAVVLASAPVRGVGSRVPVGLSGRVDMRMVEKTVLCLIGSAMVRDGKQLLLQQRERRFFSK